MWWWLQVFLWKQDSQIRGYLFEEKQFLGFERNIEEIKKKSHRKSNDCSIAFFFPHSFPCERLDIKKKKQEISSSHLRRANTEMLIANGKHNGWLKHHFIQPTLNTQGRGVGICIVAPTSWGDCEKHTSSRVLFTIFLCASVRVPTDRVPTTQSLNRKVGTLALWPQARMHIKQVHWHKLTNTVE